MFPSCELLPFCIFLQFEDTKEFLGSVSRYLGPRLWTRGVCICVGGPFLNGCILLWMRVVEERALVSGRSFCPSHHFPNCASPWIRSIFF